MMCRSLFLPSSLLITRFFFNHSHSAISLTITWFLRRLRYGSVFIRRNNELQEDLPNAATVLAETRSGSTRIQIRDAKELLQRVRLPPLFCLLLPICYATAVDAITDNVCLHSFSICCWFKRMPYTPIELDPRYGYNANTPLSVDAGFSNWQMGNNNIAGRDELSERYTRTAVLGETALQALKRFGTDYRREGKPFSLSVHFGAPHPPVVATGSYLDYYWRQRYKLLMPQSTC